MVVGAIRMSKGRPPTGRPNRTELIRVRSDLADMIRWICRAEVLEAADLLDPLIREAIQERYAGAYALIRQMKRRDDANKAAAGEELGAALPQFNTLDPLTGEMVTLEELERRHELRSSLPPIDTKKKPKK